MSVEVSAELEEITEEGMGAEVSAEREEIIEDDVTNIIEKSKKE